ncbi:MAG: hypothetical protein L7F77_16585 [Candidatus Magnetominusculus sp. LBB02]|nr:hypothetical protein [Candidatus Magnetominusculus sp. LBB02]
MGITIDYEGKAKNIQEIETLFKFIEDYAATHADEVRLGTKEMAYKGNLYPLWGDACKTVPEGGELKEARYFPLMDGAQRKSEDSPKNDPNDHRLNGWFHILENGSFSEQAIASLEKGEYPEFRVDTIVKSMWLNFPGCESLSFHFDMNTYELVNYFMFGDKICAIANEFCKTQYGGVSGHIKVCGILKQFEKIIDYTIIKDEANDYYHTGNLEDLIKAFSISTSMIKMIKEEAIAILGEENVKTPSYTIDRE